MTTHVALPSLPLPSLTGYWVDGQLVITDKEGHILHAPAQWRHFDTFADLRKHLSPTLVEVLADMGKLQDPS